MSDTKPHGNAKPHGNGDAKPYGNAKPHGDAKPYRIAYLDADGIAHYLSGTYVNVDTKYDFDTNTFTIEFRRADYYHIIAPDNGGFATG